MVLSPAATAQNVIVLELNGATQAFSVATEADVKLEVKELEKTAAMQRGFDDKGQFVEPDTFFPKC